MQLVSNKRNGAVVMSPYFKGLGAAVEPGVGSNLTQPNVFFFISLHLHFIF